jgi:hypothetical protein
VVGVDAVDCGCSAGLLTCTQGVPGWPESQTAAESGFSLWGLLSPIL